MQRTRVFRVKLPVCATLLLVLTVLWPGYAAAAGQAITVYHDPT